MSERRVSLEILDVADPCTEDWAAMRGDDRSRFCGLCRKSVFDLSAMSRDEAEQVLASSSGQLCVRFYRRADGTVSTVDCAPDRMAALRKKARRGMVVAAGALAAMCAIVAGLGIASAAGGAEWLASAFEEDPCELPLMGAVEPTLLEVDPGDGPDEGSDPEEAEVEAPADPSEASPR